MDPQYIQIAFSKSSLFSVWRKGWEDIKPRVTKRHKIKGRGEGKKAVFKSAILNCRLRKKAEDKIGYPQKRVRKKESPHGNATRECTKSPKRLTARQDYLWPKSGYTVCALRSAVLWEGTIATTVSVEDFHWVIRPSHQNKAGGRTRLDCFSFHFRHVMWLRALAYHVKMRGIAPRQ